MKLLSKRAKYVRVPDHEPKLLSFRPLGLSIIVRGQGGTYSRKYQSKNIAKPATSKKFIGASPGAGGPVLYLKNLHNARIHLTHEMSHRS
jgi:hypothetical protein